MIGSVYAQDKKVRTKEYYLKKAKRDQTIGLISGVASAACLVTGIVYDNKGGEGIGETLGNGNTALFAYGGALTFGLTSVGFFVGSGYQRRKAAKLQPIAYTARINRLSPTGLHKANALHVGVRIGF